MTDEQQSNPDSNLRAVYEFRIKGHLSQQWINLFEGLTVTLEEDGNTLLNGSVIDQSALHGILKKIRDLGMPLISVNSVESDQVRKQDVDLLKGDQ